MFFLRILINRRNSTNSIFQFVGSIHNLSFNQSTKGGSSLTAKIFTSHFSQLALIFTWVLGNMFHLSWAFNYSFWMSNPGRVLSISHSVWDPNFGLYANDIFSVGYSEVTSAPSYSGIYQAFQLLPSFLYSRLILLLLVLIISRLNTLLILIFIGSTSR